MSRSVLFLITLICFSHFYIFVDCRQWKDSCSEESREFVEYYPSGKHEKVAVKHCRNKHSTSFEEKPEPEKPEEKPIFTYGKNDPFGPSNWGLISKECDGKKQSPININTWTAKPKQGKSLKIEGIRKQASSITAQNNGHGFYIKFKYANGEPAKFVGGPLKNSYIIDNIHWHWGKRDQEGSEHTINGIRYSSEAHVVSYNSKYKTISEALKYSDGLAVLGVFYKLSSRASNPFVSLIENVIESKSTYEEKDNLFSLFDVLKTDRFKLYNYSGSLTTPDCQQIVTWMVSPTFIPITSRELAKFRKIKDEAGEPIKENFRPIQLLNGRSIAVYRK